VDDHKLETTASKLGENVLWQRTV